MKIERIKNSKRNLVAGVINRILGLFVPFIMRTIMIKVLGTEYLGLNSLFTSILQVLNLSELGFSSAIVYSLYEPIARDDYNKINQLLYTFRNIYYVIGTFILCCGLMLIPVLPKLINGPIPKELDLTAIYLVFLINTVSSYLFGGYKRPFFTGIQRDDIDDNISSILHIMIYPVQMLALVLFKNYYIYVLFMPVMTIAQNIICSRTISKRFPAIKPINGLNAKERKKLIKKALSVSCQKVGSTLTNSFDSIIVSSFLGLSILAIYSNYYYVVTVVLALIQILYRSVLGGLGNSIAIETKEKNYEIFTRLYFLNSYVQVACTTLLLCLYQPFMKMWAGEEVMFQNSTMVLFCVYFYVFANRKIVLMFKDAAGIWEKDMIRPIVSGVINLILNIVFAFYIGVNGVVLSTIITYAFIDTPWETHVLFKEYFGKQTIEHFNTILLVLLQSVVICITAYYLNNLFELNGLMNIIVKGGIAFFLSTMMFVIIHIGNPNLRYFVGLLKGLIKRNRK